MKDMLTNTAIKKLMNGCPNPLLDHFDMLKKHSIEIANETNSDDWRKGFIDAIRGEWRCTEAQSAKIIYMGCFLEWLSANLHEFDTSPDFTAIRLQ